jgi:hypothetical protein
MLEVFRPDFVSGMTKWRIQNFAIDWDLALKSSFTSQQAESYVTGLYERIQRMSSAHSV